MVDHFSKLNALNTGVNASFHEVNAPARHTEQRVCHVGATLAEQAYPDKEYHNSVLSDLRYQGVRSWAALTW